jgi:hypothetical protein
MNSSIAMRFALLAGLLAAATAQARPVTAADERPMGFVPHRSVLQAAEALYVGDSMPPLQIILPVAMADRAPMTVAPVRARTGLPMLYSQLSREDELEMEGAWRSAEDHSPSRQHERDRRRIDLGEGGEQGGQASGGGTPSAVPLPGSLPLLGSLLALCMAGAGLLRRAAD